MEEKEKEKQAEIPQIKPDEEATDEKPHSPVKTEEESEDTILIPKVDPGKAKEEVPQTTPEAPKKNFFSVLRDKFKDRKTLARIGMALAAVIILILIPLLSVFVRSK